MNRSALIFHGPGARQHVLDEAARVGRLLAPPFGEDGLKVDQAREAVALIQSVPLGLNLGVVVIGPLDLAAPKSADVLLKVVEEFHEFVRPMLWAHDLGGVRGTIQSRCLDVWCPATGLEIRDEELEEAARELLNANLNGQFYKVPAVVSKMKGKELELLGEVAEAMTVMLDNPLVLPLWERVRATSMWRNPTPMEVISTFLPEV